MGFAVIRKRVAWDCGIVVDVALHMPAVGLCKRCNLRHADDVAARVRGKEPGQEQPEKRK
jgi:hypothetical protein